jgi:hypothetical protein
MPSPFRPVDDLSPPYPSGFRTTRHGFRNDGATLPACCNIQSITGIAPSDPSVPFCPPKRNLICFLPPPCEPGFSRLIERPRPRPRGTTDISHPPARSERAWDSSPCQVRLHPKHRHSFFPQTHIQSRQCISNDTRNRFNSLRAQPAAQQHGGQDNACFRPAHHTTHSFCRPYVFPEDGDGRVTGSSLPRLSSPLRGASGSRYSRTSVWAPSGGRAMPDSSRREITIQVQDAAPYS